MNIMPSRHALRTLRQPRTALLAVAVAILLAAVASAAESWPRFRGPGGTGVAADDARLPETWSATDNVAWTADVPGWGWASPIIADGKVYLSTVVADDDAWAPSKGLYLGEGVRDPAAGVHHWLVLCYDLNTGRELWRQEAHVGEPTVPRHPKSTYAAETPTTDGERVWGTVGVSENVIEASWLALADSFHHFLATSAVPAAQPGNAATTVQP